LQKYTEKGWRSFAVIGLLFYVVITLAMSYPTQIYDRPEYLPVLIVIFAIMPMVYINIVRTLHQQKQYHEMSQQENIWQLQTKNMVDRLGELNETNEAFRIERHDFRHKLKMIASLVETKQYDELAKVVAEYEDTLEKTRIVRYCKSAIIDAALSVYIKKAESIGIPVKWEGAFPDTFEVNESELATALANAIENAINASLTLPEKDRRIEIKVLCKPKFVIMVRNSFDGNVVFDDDGIPQSPEDGHGFGAKTIVALCRKVGGYCDFQAEGNVFSLFMHLK
jgi:sensor histidine kinase regulating citrate/malate metabolism